MTHLLSPLSHFELALGKVNDTGSSLIVLYVYEYRIFLTSFVEVAIFLPMYVSGIFAKNKIAVHMCEFASRSSILIH